MPTDGKNGRNTAGRFGPGNTGKPKGARHKLTIALESLLDGQAEALTQRCIDAALGGDMAALRLCMDRIAIAVQLSSGAAGLMHALGVMSRWSGPRLVLAVLLAFVPGLALGQGAVTKGEVRAHAGRLGLRTAHKPDSQDVCFIRSDTGRAGFLGDRVPLHVGRLVDHDTGADLGEVPAVELVTVGQRRGMGHGTDGRRRFVTAVDVAARRVTVGPPEAAYESATRLGTVAWVAGPPAGGPDGWADALAQCSAHGVPTPCTVSLVDDGLEVTFDVPQRRVAPGQTVALYDPARPEAVVGSGVVR